MSGFDLFSRRICINTMFDYRSGSKTLEATTFSARRRRAPVAKRRSTAPLWMQARAVALASGTRIGGTTYTTRLGYFVSNQFWMFRELSATAQLPQIVNRYLRSQNGSAGLVEPFRTHAVARIRARCDSSDGGIQPRSTGLIRQYGRSEDQVFPSGIFFKGGTYGADVNFPVPSSEQVNPLFTAYLDRKA